MSHNPQASEPFQFPKPVPPLTDNVIKLLENCRRRARDHGVTQFTGNADGLFANELAAALMADGKAVAPELDVYEREKALIKNYGRHVAAAMIAGETLQRIYDILRPHVVWDTPNKVCSHSWLGAVTSPLAIESLVQVARANATMSRYGIRAFLYQEIYQDNKVLDMVIYLMELYEPGVRAALKEKFPLS